MTTTADLQHLVERTAILDTVVTLFVATDQRDWERVRSCLASPVTLDMTSLAGGAPSRLEPSEVVDGWRNGLRAIDHVHHQLGNFTVRIHGDEAEVFCYGVAYHHRNVSSPDNVRTFVGSYDIHLHRTSGAWLINLFRFNAAFVTGNLQLEAAT
jgi:hypothetical protein